MESGHALYVTVRTANFLIVIMLYIAQLASFCLPSGYSARLSHRLAKRMAGFMLVRSGYGDT